MMRSCCVQGYDRFFDAKQARRDARRYRRRGLDRAARRLLELLRSTGVEDATVLEAGGGVGAIQIELLKAGARSATNFELSPGYEEEAARLAGEAGLSGRIERRLHDFAAAAPEAVDTADLVILHRVVCCYPEPELLVGAAAAKARRALVLSFPPDNAAVRLGARAINLVCAARGLGFRVYVHPRRAILRPALRAGLTASAEGRSGFWRVAAFERLSG